MHPHQHIVTAFLHAIGEDPNRPDLIDTPRRVQNAWKELFAGYQDSQRPLVTTFKRDRDQLEGQLVIDTGTFYSHCEHHLLPFFGTYRFAYAPNQVVVGLSKIQRIVSYHAARLQTQERLGDMIVADLEETLKPHGIGLTLFGRHLCREMRGARSPLNTMYTEHLRGQLNTDPELTRVLRQST